MSQLITVEGLDGAGTTTLVSRLEERMSNVVTTAEPSELWTGKQVRRCLKDESIHPLTDFYFFMGDRVHHIEEEVKPAIAEGKTVISDRYADSTRAYQPVGLVECDHFYEQSDAKLFIEQAMAPWNFKPDVTIYVDISIDTAMERMDGDEKYEKRQFLEQVKENYDELVENEAERFIVIDGEQSKDEVVDEAISALDLPPLDRI